jgi:hypothetical protein
MWSEILLWQFPETQNYSHHRLPRDDRGFFTYVTSQAKRHPDAIETSNVFLAVKFKEGPEDDAVVEWDPEIWDPEIDRLRKTLSAPGLSVGYGWQSYGAVAVGKSVRFFEFNQNTRKTVAWAPQAPDILPYCLKRDFRQIQLTLNWIKKQYPEKPH